MNLVVPFSRNFLNNFFSISCEMRENVNLLEEHFLLNNCSVFFRSFYAFYKTSYIPCI